MAFFESFRAARWVRLVNLVLQAEKELQGVLVLPHIDRLPVVVLERLPEVLRAVVVLLVRQQRPEDGLQLAQDAVVGVPLARVGRLQHPPPDVRLHEQLLEDAVHVAGGPPVAKAHVAAVWAGQGAGHALKGPGLDAVVHALGHEHVQHRQDVTHRFQGAHVAGGERNHQLQAVVPAVRGAGDGGQRQRLRLDVVHHRLAPPGAGARGVIVLLLQDQRLQDGGLREEEALEENCEEGHS